MNFNILFENSEIFLINKPYGTAVQGGEGVAHPLDKEFSLQVGFPVHLVHRLDKETAGILVVAKNGAAASKWTKIIGDKEVKKEYYAVTIGVPVIKGKECNKGVLRSSVTAHGKEQTAETFFEVEKSWEVEIPDNSSEENNSPEKIKLCLVHLTLGTGRMHQLRIQLAQAKAPIAADDLHGAFKINKKLRKAGIKKLQLAAVRVTVPLEGKKQLFEIPFPEHFCVEK